MIDLSAYDAFITNEALLLNLDPVLIKAFITVESHGNPWAIRFEMAWKYFYFPRGYAENLNITVETEQNLQASSWGLMQVMGSVAREFGFKDTLLKLTDPALGLRYACLKLKSLFQKHYNEEDVISAYNQGSPRKTNGGFYLNQLYCDRIHQALIELRKLKT